MTAYGLRPSRPPGGFGKIGRLDEPAREATIAEFTARHPKVERLPASEAAGQIIAWAAREHPAWFWRGVALPGRR